MRHTRIGKLTAEIRKISICKNISIILQHLIIHIENRKKKKYAHHTIYFIFGILGRKTTCRMLVYQLWTKN